MTKEKRLFTYTVRFDDGAAPNPFNGMCTLAICKPGIRAVAKKGDWIAGFGSANAPSGDLSSKLIYAMLVEEVLDFNEYYEKAVARWPHRIPNIKSASMQDRLGDCIYKLQDGKLQQFVDSVHNEGNQEADLSGKHVLISHENYYYFGRNAIELPSHLSGIRHPYQGHKSNINNTYLGHFEKWIATLKYEKGKMYGWPDHHVTWSSGDSCRGCDVRRTDDQHDPEC